MQAIVLTTVTIVQDDQAIMWIAEMEVVYKTCFASHERSFQPSSDQIANKQNKTH